MTHDAEMQCRHTQWSETYTPVNHLYWTLTAVSETWRWDAVQTHTVIRDIYSCKSSLLNTHCCQWHMTLRCSAHTQWSETYTPVNHLYWTLTAVSDTWRWDAVQTHTVIRDIYSCKSSLLNTHCCQWHMTLRCSAHTHSDQRHILL